MRQVMLYKGEDGYWIAEPFGRSSGVSISASKSLPG